MKECSWALVQYKSRPRDGERAKGRASIEGDSRTEDKWCLVEEFVPREYVDQLRAGKKKISKRVSFLRAVRRKSIKSAVRPNVSAQIAHSTISASAPLSNVGTSASRMGPITSRTVDETLFTTREGETKLVSASNIDLAGRESQYATSNASTSGHGHSNTYAIPPEEERNPLPPAASPRTQR